jgi:hypothetical protein
MNNSCMYVCMYVCMYDLTYYKKTCIIIALMYVCMYACMDFLHEGVHNSCMYLCIYVCMYVCMYDWVDYNKLASLTAFRWYTCKCTHIQTHIQKCAHTYIHAHMTIPDSQPHKVVFASLSTSLICCTCKYTHTTTNDKPGFAATQGGLGVPFRLDHLLQQLSLPHHSLSLAVPLLRHTRPHSQLALDLVHLLMRSVQRGFQVVSLLF